MSNTTGSRASRANQPGRRPTQTKAKQASNATGQPRTTADSGPGSGRPRRPQPTALARLRARHPALTALVPVVLVIALVVTMVLIKVTGSDHTAPTKGAAGNIGTSALPVGVLADIMTISTATQNAVGAPNGLGVPAALPSSAPPLVGANGKPEVLYIGAEYCPYCAAERWAVVEALSRFGTFSGLSATHSSSVDVYPNTATFSFYGAHYTSPYVSFSSVEQATNQVSGSSYVPLQSTSAAQQALLAKYDVAPYTTEPSSIPFIDIANRYVVIGSSYSPQVLAGLSMSQIAGQLNNPGSQVAQAIDGTANLITAAIVKATGMQPTSVSGSSGVQAALHKLGS